ncbi:MAG: conserved membrane protein of unknown function [Promethearchaeota archaeon]|nr:MAG: conserved membrane protein of unknown function [Candidatus Lokiarchaeota archaeon]
MNEEFTEYSDKKEKVATVFYIILVAAWLVTIAGSIWTIADILNPTGKLEAFLNINLGYQIAIIGGILAGLFFLLVFFIGFYKRGIKTILKILYKKRELEEKYKNRIDVQIAAAGFLISLIVVIVGLGIALLWDTFSGTDEAIFSFTTLILVFPNGVLVLFAGLGLFLIIGIIIFIIYFIRNGYYLVLKIFGILEKEE